VGCAFARRVDGPLDFTLDRPGFLDVYVEVFKVLPEFRDIETGVVWVWGPVPRGVSG
jgi:hypothetical protein